MRPFAALVAALILLPLFAAAADDQAQPSPPTAPPPSGAGAATPSPLDSLLKGFSWTRFETVAVGSFPISMFYVGFGFDMAAYASNNFNSLFAPWPFKNPQAPALTDSEKVYRLSGALILSLSVAVIDALLLPPALARRERELGKGPFPLPPPPETLGLPLPVSPPKDGTSQAPGTSGTSGQDGAPAVKGGELDSTGARQ
jgi:hypothetical protein